jgi:excinuclease ABC subunit A
MNGEQQIEVPQQRRTVDFSACITISGAMQNNLKNIDVQIPLKVMTCITGVSGSGKSTLINDILCKGILREKHGSRGTVGTHRSLTGAWLIDRIEHVDQSPIGKSSRSNPVTYMKIFDDIRTLFANTPDARKKKVKAGYFSFNIPGGRCEVCSGEGSVHIEMQFLADIEAVCEACNGLRYQPEALAIKFNGKSIAEVLDMTVSEALSFFKGEKNIVKKLSVLDQVGLGYIRLGQSSSTFSGGEAQRLKLATFIAHADTTHTLFVFDEPTTGLHFEDIKKLILCFEKLLEQNNSLIIIEHNLDIIKQADWVIDLGPGAGDKGGHLVAQGTPEEVAQCTESLTGQYLRGVVSVVSSFP